TASSSGSRIQFPRPASRREAGSSWGSTRLAGRRVSVDSDMQLGPSVRTAAPTGPGRPGPAHAERSPWRLYEDVKPDPPGGGVCRDPAGEADLRPGEFACFRGRPSG